MDEEIRRIRAKKVTLFFFNTISFKNYIKHIYYIYYIYYIINIAGKMKKARKIC